MDFSWCEYSLSRSMWFKKVNELNGLFSNMFASPVKVNGITFRTTEALFQACRFPDYPDVQREVINQQSPMSAKMKAKAYKKAGYTRSDWGDTNLISDENNLRVEVMRWCIRVKLAYHFRDFSSLLLRNKTFDIVEYAPTKNHTFWGAFPFDENKMNLKGQNILGKLLMELRHEFLLKLDQNQVRDFLCVPVPEISNFLMLGKQIQSIDNRKA